MAAAPEATRTASAPTPAGPRPGPPPRPARVLLAPRMWWLHAAGAVAIVAAVLLSQWQYDAWDARRTIEASQVGDAPPRPITDLLGPDQPFPESAVGRPVKLHGTWAPEGSFAVSGRERDGRPGYWVVTPLVLDATGSAIPVVRGWSATPEPGPPPTGSADVIGVLQPAEGAGLPDPRPTDRVLPELRVASITSMLDRDLYGGYAIADGVEPPGAAGLRTVTPEQLPQVSALTGGRNLFYAFEWLVFGIFALYLWWRWGRDEVDAARARHATPDVGEHPDPGPEPAAYLEPASDLEPDPQPHRAHETAG